MLKTALSWLLLGACCALALPASACTGRLHLGVGPSGVYRLDHAVAIAAQPGLDGCPIAELELRNKGKAVPLRVVDNGDGVFNGDDYIEWIGLQLHGPQTWTNPFSHVNAYELGTSSAPHPRFVERRMDATGTTAADLSRHLHLEHDQMMMRLKTTQVEAGDLPDLWYWAKLTMVDPKPFEAGFDLPGLADETAPVAMRLGFRGWSEVNPRKGHDKPADHHVDVILNGHPIGSLEWNGDAHIERTFEVPRAALRESSNRLVLDVPSRLPPWSTDTPLVDVVMFDYIDLDYPLAHGNATAPFRVDHSGAPSMAAGAQPLLFGSDGVLYLPSADKAGARYASIPATTHIFPLDPAQSPLIPINLRAVDATTDWHQPAQGYDYIIIAHPDLLAASRPLAEFHRRHGRTVALVSTDAIYDQFNHGITDPRAIRAFLEHAWKTWPAPKLHYVLLVGDASFDLSDHQRDQRFYAKWTDRELLFPGQFGTIPGTPYADTGTAPAARNLIPTFQYYSAEGQSASDNGFVDFGKDGSPALAIGRLPVVHPDEVKAIVDKTIAYVEEPRVGAWRQSAMFITDDNPSFQSASDKLANEVGDLGFNAERVYPASSDKDNLAHQKTIMQGLDDGQLLVHFLGHGGRYIWRTGPPDPRKNHDLFTLDDVGKLSNAGKLPMVLSMTCYSAPFDNPNEDSIGERFLREADNGAIAVFAASWRNSPDAQFSRELLGDLLQPGVAIGDAILKAKRATKNRDMVEMYNLLGDPAIPLQRPREQMRMMQVRDRWSPRVAIEIPGSTRFHGTLRVEWLDRQLKTLSRVDYQIDTPRLLLPPAPANAHEVRVYALDPSRTNDAIGGLTLSPAPTITPWWRAAWRQLISRTKQPPPAADRIFGDYFGG
ncbi:MAG TPA: C25 family cysteine peptidase [Rhodanobacteraceae bacterium]|nr:C25 family cysteine peptidase [Rhodanobacteraceae bacterium]